MRLRTTRRTWSRWRRHNRRMRFWLTFSVRLTKTADPTIPIARVLDGQVLNLAQQRRIVGRMRDILERRPMDLHQGTGTAHRQATRNQELNSRALLGQRQPFFCSTSLSRSFSSIRSANRRLSRLFSFSSSFKRWTSLTDMPP